MVGLEWMDIAEACDLLRVGDDNADIIEAHAEVIPYYVEITTGYPATLAMGDGCAETVKALCRFLLCKFFNPDGTDAAQLTATIESLTKAVKALVIAEGLDEETTVTSGGTATVADDGVVVVTGD